VLRRKAYLSVHSISRRDAWGKMGMVQATKSNEKYRPDIDGLRAIAILSVILYHAGLPLFTGGFTGVDVFFVISGYLIGGHIFSELRSGTFSFLRFYQRRGKRILPAFYVVIAFTVLAAIVLLSPAEVNQFAKGATAAILSVSNIYFLASSTYFQPKSEFNPLLMTWSLGVEEQFYALIPLLMVVCARIRRKLLMPAVLVGCVLSFAFAWYEVSRHPNMVFYLLPARAWELGAGVALAIAETGRKGNLVPARWLQVASLVGLALILIPVLVWTPATHFLGPAALPSILGAALLIATRGSWINRTLLSLPPLVFIGRISYSWYLWHWPLLAFLRIASGGVLPGIAVALAIAVSFAAAVLSYYFIEQPFRGSSSAAAPLLLRYAAASVCLLALCGALWASGGLPSRHPALIEEVEAASDHPCLVGYGIDAPDLSSRCYSASDPRPSVALWGDSHAASLAPALRQIANGQGYSFVQIGKASCLPLNDVAKFVPMHPLVVRECIHFNHEALNLIAADPRIRTVIMAGRWEEPFLDGGVSPLVSNLQQGRQLRSSENVRSIFVQSLSATVRALQRDGKNVIVVDDVPNFDFDPSFRFRTARIAARRSMANWLGVNTGDAGLPGPTYVSAAGLSTELLNKTLEDYPGVELFDPKLRLCNVQGLCTYQSSDRLFYSDEQHLTPDGAKFALRDFRLPSL
jgi:peptidoglycan/LPS O-acetylase OafA/YrhL